MRRGYVDKITHEVVSGWAADDAEASARLELRVTVNGVDVGGVIADRPRHDLAASGKFGDGAHGFSFLFPDRLAPDTDSLVIIRYSQDSLPVPGGEKLLRRAIRGQAAPDTAAVAATGGAGPVPIVVGAPSRSGTTYMMSCLAACPDIVAASVLPYELRLLDYYAAAHGVLTAQADWTQSLHPDRLGLTEFTIGHNPFTAHKYEAAFKDREAMRELFAQWAPGRLGETMAEIVREFYRRLAVDQGKTAPGQSAIPYFAEKNINLHRQTRLFIHRVFPVLREIAIVRDPRDILCSHLSYYTPNPERSVTDLTGSCRTLTQMQKEAASDLLFVRYEDLLQDEEASFGRLSAFLGVNVLPVHREAGGELFKTHATSSTPAASIGRWRSDLPQTLQTQVNASWGEFLERFGYDRC